MDVNSLLFECELSIAPDSFNVHAPDMAIARSLKKAVQQMALEAARLGRRLTVISYPGCDRPYQIPASFADESGGVPPEPNLLGADYMKILEFLVEQRQEGNIVIITSNTSDVCYHTNDLLLPSRSTWQPAQFTGYNYRRSWRASRDEDPNNPQRLNPEYDRLRDLLRRDGVVRDYEYSLYRPDDALCRYSTTYFLCRDYCGDEVRIGVSRPADWSIAEPSPVV